MRNLPCFPSDPEHSAGGCEETHKTSLSPPYKGYISGRTGLSVHHPVPRFLPQFPFSKYPQSPRQIDLSPTEKGECLQLVKLFSHIAQEGRGVDNMFRGGFKDLLLLVPLRVGENLDNH